MTLRELPAELRIVTGHHEDCDGTDGCVMDLVSWVCGYAKITDHPECASGVATAFAIPINDAMPNDETRTRLLGPLILRLAGSKASPEIEQKRAYLLADRAVRVFAPLALDAAGLQEEANKLRALPEVVDAARAARAARAAWAASADSATRAAWAAWDARAASADWAASAASAAWDARAASAASAEVWVLAAQALSDALDIRDGESEEDYRG